MSAVCVASLFESCIVCALYFLPDRRTPRCLRWLQHNLTPIFFCHKFSRTDRRPPGDKVYSFNGEGQDGDTSHASSADSVPLQWVGAAAGARMNPESEWRELTCEGSQHGSIYRNRQGELTLERPSEGVCASVVESDGAEFEKQYLLYSTFMLFSCTDFRVTRNTKHNCSAQHAAGV
jgi:hypothetical protein|eukprot:COSAG02_NODE_1133_length_14390_cov_3.493178_12_plen_177_part_00